MKAPRVRIDIGGKDYVLKDYFEERLCSTEVVEFSFFCPVYDDGFRRFCDPNGCSFNFSPYCGRFRELPWKWHTYNKEAREAALCTYACLVLHKRIVKPVAKIIAKLIFDSREEEIWERCIENQ